MTLAEMRDATRIEHIHDIVERVAVLMGGLEKEDFLADEMRCEALAHNLTLLGEATNKLSRAFKANHPEVDWRRIVQLRNDIIHDYSEVSYEEMWHHAETTVVAFGRRIQLIYEALPQEPPLSDEEKLAIFDTSKE